jgi:hypothetical protein
MLRVTKDLSEEQKKRVHLALEKLRTQQCFADAYLNQIASVEPVNGMKLIEVRRAV